METKSGPHIQTIAQKTDTVSGVLSSTLLPVCAMLVLVLIAPFFTQPSQADIYYKKKKGVPFYTDTPNERGFKRIIKYGVSRSRSWTQFTYSKTYDRHIRKTARGHGVDPNLVKAIIKVESDFNKYAVSRKGAKGVMQLMPETARRHGVNDPFNPAQNIKGGVEYLDELMDMFDSDLELVLAAYNAGENAVVSHGYRIPPYSETRDYVDKVLIHYNHLKSSAKHGI